jgi:hypothetical protein
MQTSRCAHALIERSEHDRENSPKGTMKSPDRIGKCVGMLFDGSRHPRVSKLQE